jgi:hypothetical protein
MATDVIQAAKALPLGLAMALVAAACGGDGGGPEPAFEARFESTALCSLVAPPRAEEARPAVRPLPYGTDLGFSYESNGVVTMLFGDTWPGIDVCPLFPNDDSLASFAVPADDWPGFAARAPIADSDCLRLDFATGADGTEIAPLVLERWDGVPIPLGPLNTPVAAFHDGRSEWGVFILGGGLACSEADATRGAPCPADLDPAAAGLACGFAGGQPLCLDPTSSQGPGVGQAAAVLHFAERVGPTSYVSRHAFVTNKFLNLTVRAVAAFADEGRGERDYRPGGGALFAWGRPGFDAKAGGEAPPYLFHLPLPLERDGERIVFAPRFLRDVVDGQPVFGSEQGQAQPLYAAEFDPVNQAAVTYLAALDRWLLLYGGDLPDVLNADGNDPSKPQPLAHAIHARFAPDPWGPWTAPRPILGTNAMARHLVCAPNGSPPLCLPHPDPPIRPACLEAFDRDGRGRLYGVNVLDALTRATPGGGVDVFWNVSTWHPYAVVLVKTNVE